MKRSGIKTFKIVKGVVLLCCMIMLLKLAVLNMLHTIVSLEHINTYPAILYSAAFVFWVLNGMWLLYVAVLPTAPLSFFPSRAEFLMQKRAPPLQFPALYWLNNPFHLFFIRLTPLTGAVIPLHCKAECWGGGGGGVMWFQIFK